MPVQGAGMHLYCWKTHTENPFPHCTAAPDGWQTGMLTGPNHLLQLSDTVPPLRERGGGTRVGTWCICFRCVALHHSLKGLCTRAKFWLGIPVVIVWKSAHVCFVGVFFFRRVFLCQLFVFSPSLIKCNAPVAGCLMTLIGRGSHIGG